jgi:hypothetical protein
MFQRALACLIGVLVAMSYAVTTVADEPFPAHRVVGNV